MNTPMANNNGITISIQTLTEHHRSIITCPRLIQSTIGLHIQVTKMYKCSAYFRQYYTCTIIDH